MSNRKPEDEPSTSQMKRRKIKNEEEQQTDMMNKEAPNRLATVAVPNELNEEARPQIFKLDVDCVQEIFDWLSIADINSVAETCTRMQRIAGDYFETNLAGLELKYQDGELKCGHSDSNGSGFKEFVQKLEIYDDGFRFIELHCKSLKQIVFAHSQLNTVKIDHIKPSLSEIEAVTFYNVDFDGELYENFLQFCPKLKHLCINQYSSKRPLIVIGTTNEWLLRSYPTLEQLKIHSDISLQIPMLRTFLDCNPNLQNLLINGNSFDALAQNYFETTLTNKKLQVFILDTTFCKFEEHFDRRLNQLYDQGFYHRLHLRMGYVEQQEIEKVSALNGLETLCLYRSTSNHLNLNSLINLQELRFDFMRDSIDLKSTAKALLNLERLYVGLIRTEQIEPFVEFSAKLKVINIKYSSIDEGNLSAWNKKREKLVGARRVTIYLHDKYFVAMKWSNKTIDFDMIQVKRAESYSEHIPF